MGNLGFKIGKEKKLSQNLENGIFYVTTDTKKIRLNDCVWEDTNLLRNDINNTISGITTIINENEEVTANALNGIKNSLNTLEKQVDENEEVTANALNDLKNSFMILEEQVDENERVTAKALNDLKNMFLLLQSEIQDLKNQ